MNGKWSKWFNGIFKTVDQTFIEIYGSLLKRYRRALRNDHTNEWFARR